MERNRLSSLIKPLRYFLFSWVFLLLAAANAAAQASHIEMADKLREDGKIWVVVGVVILIFIGIVAYLIRLDGKISRLEKQLK